MFVDARKLVDKTARTHMTAQLELFPNMRDLGQESYLLHHHVWDGAVRSAMEKLNRQYHSAHFERQRGRWPPKSRGACGCRVGSSTSIASGTTATTR